MATHLLRDLDGVKRDVLTMGGLVEEALSRAVDALINRRPELAREVVRGDDAIDSHELRLEEDCLKILALHQPVAGDLRFIIAILKVNNDLERVGDLAKNIASRALELCALPASPHATDLREMTESVRAMLRESLDALVNRDAQLARRICDDDVDVDVLHRERFQALTDLMRKNPATIDLAIHLLSVSRHLERIADHATNIAEDVVFMVEGEVIRHRRKG